MLFVARYRIGVGDNRCYSLSNQISGQLRYSIPVAFCHTNIDRDIFPISVTRIAKPPAKRSNNKVCYFSAPQQTNDWQHWLLRLHRKRPRCRNATNKADKVPSSHGRPLGRNVQE
jgi:hypothetical protein